MIKYNEKINSDNKKRTLQQVFKNQWFSSKIAGFVGAELFVPGGTLNPCFAPTWLQRAL
jgi:hypothetical protein